MKLAYIVTTLPALSETFILREIQGMVARGCEVDVFALKRAKQSHSTGPFCVSEVLKRSRFSRPDNLLRDFAANLTAFLLHPVRYCSILSIYAKESWSVAPSMAMRILYHFFCGIGIAATLRRRKVVHIHSHFAGVEIALAASLFSGVPYSWTAQASKDIYVKPVLLRAKVRYCRFIAAVSSYNKRYLESLCPGSSSKIHVIPNGVYLSEAHVAEALKAARPATMFRIVSAGRLIAVKGFQTLIETCDILRHRGCQIECRILGGGEEEGALRRMISERGLDEVVSLSGYLPLREIYAEMAEGDVFVLLSEIGENGYRDGLPTVIIEAMLMSLPVVSTYISGIPELVIDSVTGFLVPERNPNTAADALERLIADSKLRTGFGSAGRARVEARFDADTNLDCLFKMITSDTREANSFTPAPVDTVSRVFPDR